MEIIAIVLFSYFCGSIPFGIILTKLFTNTDVRNVGSGNIGATNVLRTGNKLLALLTLVLDALKGYLPVIIAQIYFSEYYQLAALTTFLGHIFPVWLKFNGGKGVATYLGVLFALSNSLGALFIFTWIVVLLIFKFSSLSSMFASLTVFVISFLREHFSEILNSNIEPATNSKLILFIFFILIIFTHKKNIIDLINRKERKIKI